LKGGRKHQRSNNLQLTEGLRGGLVKVSKKALNEDARPKKERTVRKRGTDTL